MNPLRILHLPNERTADPDQQEVQVRCAFAQYQQEGLVGEIRTIPFPLETERLGGPAPVLARILEAADAFRPDLVFWQNVDAFPVTPEYLRRLKQAPSRPVLFYADGDPYGPRGKFRMPPPVRAMMREADAVGLVGRGLFADLARQAGAREVLYIPFSFDRVRFGRPAATARERPDAVSMIGSLWKSRIPFLLIPGARQRQETADRLAARYGARFALYGNGWTRNASARGPLPFTRQQEAIQQSWVNVSWNHFTHVADYFSDRLPIALAAGVAHVMSWQPGFDAFFADCPGLFLARTPKDACDQVDALLARDPDDLIDLGRQAREWAYAHLEATVVFRPVIARCLQLRNASTSAAP